MLEKLIGVVRFFRPDFDKQSELARIQIIVDVWRVLYSTLGLTIGLIWLFAIVNWSKLADEWPALTLMAGCAIAIGLLRFFVHIQMTKHIYNDIEGSMMSIIVWAMIFAFGPIAIVVHIPMILVYRMIEAWYKRPLDIYLKWAAYRNVSENLAIATFYTLIGLTFYEAIGGTFPINSDTFSALLPAILTILLMGLLNLPVLLPILLMIFFYPLPGDMGARSSRLVLLAQIVSSAVMDTIIALFAILAAVIYLGLGWGYFAFFVLGVALIAFLANRFSTAADNNRQRNKELELLQDMSRELLETPPNQLDLAAILEKHAAYMFFRTTIEIRLFPQQTLILHNYPTEDWQTDSEGWAWFMTHPQVHIFSEKQPLPWAASPSNGPLVLMPILSNEGTETYGGIWLAFSARQNMKTIQATLPSLHALASQIGSALSAAQSYEQTLASEKMKQELLFAGRIQASFLPEMVPTFAGWQISAILESARQTSGDFYDFIHLPDNRLGIVVADVADKGTGAALFMALSRTLLRTYALEYPNSPARVFEATNTRILQDTRSDQFVTVFYGVLNPEDGTLIYANAGHNPPYLMHDEFVELKRTGIPLGMMDNMRWKEQSVTLAVDVPLILYTDGVTEAQDNEQALYTEQRLIDVATTHPQASANDLEVAILDSIHEFMGDAPPADDITLVILKRLAGQA